MENASKALIIAGAILLAILIIALGVMVYNNAKETVGNSNLDSTEISSFNSQWQAYVGTNQTAAQVKSLVAAAVANNAAEEKSGADRTVTINNTDPESIDTNTYASNVTYTIQVEYDPDGSGLITNITVN